MSKEAKWQEVYKVQTAAIAELEQRIAELEAECNRWADADIEKDGKVFRLKERIAELEALLNRWISSDGWVTYEDHKKCIAELEQAVADHIKLQGIQFEKGVNEGMERAADMLVCAKWIRKEIDK